MKKKIENIIKNNSLINRMFTFFGSLVFKLFGVFVKKEDKSILFVSYMGKSFNDSPKKIFEELIDDKYFEDYTFYWAFSNVDKYKVPNNVKVVRMDSMEYFKTALKTSIWVTNVNIERGLHFKKKSTCYVNTWHGIPLKNVGNDVKGRNDFDFSGISYFPYSGDFEKEIYTRAFKVKDKNLRLTGMPRNDILITGDKSIVNKVKEEYGIHDQKIILYAPTWRDNEKDLPPLDLSIWDNLISNGYVLFVRSHGLVEKFEGLNSRGVIDVSDYEETADLLLSADILVTDYSSIMFDYSLTEKPIFIYAPDYEKYNSERGMYFDLKTKSLPVFDNEIDLVENIKNLDEGLEKENVIKFKKEFFGYSSSDSTQKIVEFLKDRKW